jgi:signal transduction histidine kinase
VRKDGSRIYAEISASPYRDRSGTIIGTIGLISDVSERKHLEDLLRQAQRLEAVGQLAGGVAHDFNNLLTVVKCHTELLAADTRHDSDTRAALLEIDRAADRAAGLTRQLLAFSRRQLLQPKRVSLDEIVAQTAPLLHRVVGANVELVTRRYGESRPVFVDPLQLEHVLVVLIRNANDAMPDGGRVVIETTIVDLAYAAASQEGSVPAGKYALLTVADSGHGMDSRTRARLFEPFFTTKEPGEGSGLGLASVYGIVKQSGGFIDVRSTPGIGTTFRIYLPLSQTITPVSAPQQELQPA